MSFYKLFFRSIYWLLFEIILRPKVIPSMNWLYKYICFLKDKTDVAFPTKDVSLQLTLVKFKRPGSKVP